MPQNSLLSATLALGLLLASAATPASKQAVEDRNAHPANENHQNTGDTEENEGTISLSKQQRALIGLKTQLPRKQPLPQLISAPGEVVANRYSSSVISPIKTARVLQRHVVLGDHVREGQSLVTLFSDDLLNAQTRYINAHKEWALVKQLGKQSSGRNRYENALTAFRAARTQLTSFGLSRTDINKLDNATAPQSLGQLVLKAPFAGVIQSDDFIIGEQADPGQPLITLVDESEIWVEALLPPDALQSDNKKLTISVRIGNEILPGQLIQQSHSIDERTRTRMMRVAVDNSAHNLHPGQFANVDFRQSSKTLAYLLPEQALTRTADGDWALFYEVSPGKFQQEEVEVIADLPGERAVSGLRANQAVVTQGTFYLASEQAKSGFNTHGH